MTIINFPVNLQALSKLSEPRFRLNYGQEIESEIAQLITLIKTQLPSLQQENLRWLALKLLENEPDLVVRVQALPGSSEVIN